MIVNSAPVQIAHAADVLVRTKSYLLNVNAYMETRGDEQAVTELYNNHANGLEAYLLSKEQNSGLVQDIVQDSFLKFYLQLKKGKDIKNPKSWLYKVATNLLMDHYRKKKALKMPEVFDETIQDDLSHGPEDCLLGIIAHLPYKYKKAVFLVDVKGVKQVEAAKQLNLASATFKSHVQRGRKLVMQGYVDCCDYEINEDGKLVGERQTKEDCKVCHQ